MSIIIIHNFTAFSKKFVYRNQPAAWPFIKVLEKQVQVYVKASKASWNQFKNKAIWIYLQGEPKYETPF